MKKYKIKPTKKQLAIMSLYWKMLKEEENLFWAALRRLENKMQYETGINDLEFFQADGGWLGIGTGSQTMKLIQGEELENE